MAANALREADPAANQNATTASTAITPTRTTAPPAVPPSTTHPPSTPIRSPNTNGGAITPGAGTPQTSLQQHAATGAAILSIYDADTNMDGGVDGVEEIFTITGGKGIIIRQLLDLVTNGVHTPMEEFRRVYEASVVEKRIIKAAKPAELNDKAKRIAAAIGGERTATRPILKGIIKSTVEENSTIVELQRKLQSAEAKFDNAIKKKGKGGGKGNASSASSSSTKNGKGGGKSTAAASKSKQKKTSNADKKQGQGRSAPGGDNKNKKKNPSSNTSNGRGRGSNTSGRR